METVSSYSVVTLIPKSGGTVRPISLFLSKIMEKKVYTRIQ